MNYFIVHENAECIQEVATRGGDCSVEGDSGRNKWLEEEFLWATAGWADCGLFAIAWEDAWRGRQRWRGVGMFAYSLVYTHFGWFGGYIFQDIMYIFWWLLVHGFGWILCIYMSGYYVEISVYYVHILVNGFGWILYCLNV